MYPRVSVVTLLLFLNGDGLDNVPDLYLVNHTHRVGRGLPERRILPIQKRRRIQRDIKLAAAGWSCLRRTGSPRHCQRPFGVRAFDFRRNVISRTTRAISQWVAALNHKTGFYAMKGQ